MIKSILGGKSKNLFDISKVITSNVVKRNGNSLICSSYGTSIGTLGSICPTLKPSDLITISFKCASEGVPSKFMAFGGRTFYSGATFLVSEIGLSSTWYLYSTDYAHRDIPNKTTYSDIQLELGSTATEYVPHELTSYKSIMKVSDGCFVTSFDERMPCKTKNLFDYKNSDSTAKTITSNGVTLSLKNDYFELYGTQQEDKYFECSLTQFNIPFTAGKTYILSLDNAIPRLAVVYFNGFYNDDTTKQLNLLRVQGTNNNPLQTFTPTKNGYFSQIVVYSHKNNRFSGNYNMRVQIEENLHKSEYVPHNYV